MLGFKGFDFIFMLQGQTDIIQPVQQTMFTEGIHVEPDCLTVRLDDLLVFQIDGQLITFLRENFFKQTVHRLLVQHDWQDSVFKTVIKENIGKTRRDDNVETVVFQSPWRVFATGTTAEVFTRNQNLRTLITRLVQHKVFA